ncbi:hypothetical protein ACI797_16425 [Geodermatophilus sp. SYSU D00691]
MIAAERLQATTEHRRGTWARVFGGGDPLFPLVDAPGVNDHPLALQLASAGGLVVIASPRTTLRDLGVIRNRAEVADFPVLGFVVNEHRTGRRKGRRGKAVARPTTGDQRSLVLDAGEKVPAG